MQENKSYPLPPLFRNKRLNKQSFTMQKKSVNYKKLSNSKKFHQDAIQLSLAKHSHLTKTLKKLPSICNNSCQTLSKTANNLLKTKKARKLNFDGQIYDGQFRWKLGQYLSKTLDRQISKIFRIDYGDFLVVKKIFRKQGKSMQRQILNSLQRVEGVIKCHGYDYDDHHQYLYLQFLSEKSLRSVLNQFGKLNAQIYRKYLQQIIRILDEIHQNQYIHLDLKSSNIFVSSSGEIKIGDFGNTIPIGYEKLPSQIGSVLWSAPEVIRGQTPTIKSDIWSLGCLALELITGKLPWYQLNFNQSYSALYCIGSWNSDPILPRQQLYQIPGKCLRINPQYRPSCKEILNYLRKF